MRETQTRLETGILYYYPCCRHTDKVWTQSEEYYGGKNHNNSVYLMKQYEREERREKSRNMKRKVKRFFIHSPGTALPVYIWRLLILLLLRCLCCSRYFKVCCAVCKIGPLSISFLLGILFVASSSLRHGSTSSCLTHLFIFSRNWIIYLRVEAKKEENNGNRNHQLLQK